MIVPIEKVGSIPQGYCLTSFDRLLADFVANIQGNIPGIGANIIVSKDAPDATLAETAVWLRLDPMNGAPTKFYKFFNGLWVSEHPVPPNSLSVILWKGSETELWNYDGGDGTDNFGTYSGGMWMIDEDFAGKFPLGPGTLESETEIMVGDNGGKEKVALELENLTAHRHKIGVSGAGIASAVDDYLHRGGGDTIQYVQGDQPNVGYTRIEGGDDQEDNRPTVAHENMPPYRAVYFAKRSSRQFYIAS